MNELKTWERESARAREREREREREKERARERGTALAIPERLHNCCGAVLRHT
jgi:hypothetical protein